jgi:hypothetical protein
LLKEAIIIIASFFYLIFVQTKNLFMKKKILLASFIVLTITATVNGQIKKGAIFLGGQISFSGQTHKTSFAPATKNTSITVSPTFGKAVKDNFIVGSDIAYSYSNSEADGNYQKSRGYGVGVFIRKYKELGKGFYLFGQARAGGAYSTNKYNSSQQPINNNTTKGFIIQIAVYPGISYAISNKLQLETGFNDLAFIGYNYSQQTSAGASGPSLTTSAFSIGSSLSNFSGVTVGFRVILN